MNRTEESRSRRKAKSKKTNLIAAAALLAIVLTVFLVVKVAGSAGQTKPKAKIDKVTDNSATANGDNKKKDEQVDADGQENAITEKVYTKEEKAELEKQNKEKYGKFYVPLPDALKPAKEMVVKGLFVTHSTAAYDFDENNIKIYEDYIKFLNGEIGQEPSGVDGVNKLERILAICNATPINALVIDIKSDDGYTTWSSDIEIVKELDTEYPSSQDDFKKLMEYMKAHEIYPIARVVVFKDFVLPEIKPEHAMQLTSGGIYKDDQGMGWVNQYDKFVWDYVVAISKEAALRGFEEIHFDYIRFPDNAAHYNQIVEYPGRDGKRKDQNIMDFIKYAKEELKPYNVKVAAAVFGIITKSWEDYPEDIGQTWIKVASAIDVISPMIYPSHYSEGWYGYEVPDKEPYGVFHKALLEALEKNASIVKPAKIRPWIQGFTASWVDGYLDYTPEVIASQVKAGEELGIDEFLIWNAGNEYEPTITNFINKVTKKPVVDPANLPEFSMTETPLAEGEEKPVVEDILGRTPLDALRKYLAARQQGYTDEVYLLTKISERADTFEAFDADYKAKGLGLNEYNIDSVTRTDTGYEFIINARFTSNEGLAEYIGGKIMVVVENQVYKVVPPQLTYTPVATEEPAGETQTPSGENNQ